MAYENWDDRCHHLRYLVKMNTPMKLFNLKSTNEKNELLTKRIIIKIGCMHYMYSHIKSGIVANNMNL